MKACEKVQGLLAASLYESLSAKEDHTLESHLRSCAACRAEKAALLRLVEAIPVETVPFHGDLRPVLLEAIRHETPGSPSVWRQWRSGQWRWASLALCAGLALVLWTSLPSYLEQPGGSVMIASPTITPLQASLAESDLLIAEQNFSAAYLTLEEGVNATPANTTPAVSSDTSRAVALMATVAFDLQWYPEAYTAYRRLQQEHFSDFSSNESNILRLELLDEARGPENTFASLNDLDRARSLGDFEAFEQVAARHPGTYVATLAVHEMAEDFGADTLLSGMQVALDTCTNPIAADQLRLEMASLLPGDSKGLEQARSLYETVAESGNTVLAQAAKISLAELDRGAQP